jgi:crotonobetainyl-CoA:carnitine CoA-transferase CaiB-like acyl-CoA transferase
LLVVVVAQRVTAVVAQAAAEEAFRERTEVSWVQVAEEHNLQAATVETVKRVFRREQHFRAV